MPTVGLLKRDLVQNFFLSRLVGDSHYVRTESTVEEENSQVVDSKERLLGFLLLGIL